MQRIFQKDSDKGKKKKKAKEKNREEKEESSSADHSDDSSEMNDEYASDESQPAKTSTPAILAAQNTKRGASWVRSKSFMSISSTFFLIVRLFISLLHLLPLLR